MYVVLNVSFARPQYLLSVVKEPWSPSFGSPCTYADMLSDDASSVILCAVSGLLSWLYKYVL